MHSHPGLSCPTAADTARIDCLSGVGQLEITCDDRFSTANARITVSAAQSPPLVPRAAGRPNATRIADCKVDSSASFRTRQGSPQRKGERQRTREKREKT